MVTGKTGLINKSYIRNEIHSSSEVVENMLLYSASAEVLAMVFCFLDFQETKEHTVAGQGPG